jgi:hypothetical protein
MSVAISTADTQNTARQPSAEATMLAKGRASMMPPSSPAMMLPTTLPREDSGTRCEAKGSSTCAATAQAPTTNEAARKVTAESDSAMPTSPMTAPNSAPTMSLRFSHHVGQRHQQQQARAVAELRERHDQPGQAGMQLQRLRDGADQRLGVIDVGHAQAAGDREDQRERGAEAGRVMGLRLRLGVRVGLGLGICPVRRVGAGALRGSGKGSVGKWHEGPR